MRRLRQETTAPLNSSYPHCVCKENRSESSMQTPQLRVWPWRTEARRVAVSSTHNELQAYLHRVGGRSGDLLGPSTTLQGNFWHFYRAALRFAQFSGNRTQFPGKYRGMKETIKAMIQTIIDLGQNLILRFKIKQKEIKLFPNYTSINDLTSNFIHKVHIRENFQFPAIYL